MKNDMEQNRKLLLIIGVPATVFLIFCCSVLLFFHWDSPQEPPGRSPVSSRSATPSASGLPCETDEEDKQVTIPPSENDTVHITSNGSKYHSEGCSSLSKSDIAILLGEALRKGYEPCSVCDPGYLPITPAPSAAPSTEPPPASSSQSLDTNPDDSEEIMVFTTVSGSKYHVDGCRYLKKGSSEIPLLKAKEEGYEPCRVCKPPE